MDRRNFIRSAGVVSASLAFPKATRLFAMGETSGRLAHVRRDDARRGPEVLRPDARLAAGGPDPRDALPEDARQRLQGRGRHGRARPEQGAGARDRVREIPGGRQAGPHAHLPRLDEELRGRPLRARQGPEGGQGGARLLPAADEAHPDRRHREGRRRSRSPRARPRTSRRRARSTSGSSTTRSGTRRRGAAASATSGSCWSPRTWAASAPT